MFKKKPAPPQPRARIRPGDQTPRNAAVFSYHASRNATLESRERTSVAEQKPERRKRRLPFSGRLKRAHIMSVLVILIVFLLSIGLDTRPKVVIVGDTADRFALQSTQVYAEAAHKMLGRSYANNNKLTINTEAVATEMKQTFPELHEVSILLPFIGRKPTIYAQPAIPQLVLATPSGQFILDSSGRVLGQMTADTPLPRNRPVPTITDQSGLEIKKGDVALPSKSVAFISDVAAQLHAKGITTESWVLPARSSQLTVKISGVPYYVKFNLQGDGREQAGAFIAVRTELQNRGEVPGQYIDVRVSGRAYYK